MKTGASPASKSEIAAAAAHGLGLNEQPLRDALALKSGEYRLYSRKSGKNGRKRNLGTFSSRQKAEQHEREVQYFKRH